jgi:hypothetical protein
MITSLNNVTQETVGLMNKRTRACNLWQSSHRDKTLVIDTNALTV